VPPEPDAGPRASVKPVSAVLAVPVGRLRLVRRLALRLHLFRRFGPWDEGGLLRWVTRWSRCVPKAASASVPLWAESAAAQLRLAETENNCKVATNFLHHATQQSGGGIHVTYDPSHSKITADYAAKLKLWSTANSWWNGKPEDLL
jgi:hypothetical protein